MPVTDPAKAYAHHTAAARHENARARMFERWGKLVNASQCQALARHHTREAQEAAARMKKAAG